MDKIRNYVENARAAGLKVERRHANRLDYLFIHEADGWVSVVETAGGDYRAVIQAADVGHAESYIAMIEPLTVPVQFI
jgi:hypothetical protein